MQDRITLRRNPQNVAVQQGSVDLYIDSSGNLVKEMPGEVRNVVGNTTPLTYAGNDPNIPENITISGTLVGSDAEPLDFVPAVIPRYTDQNNYPSWSDAFDVKWSEGWWQIETGLYFAQIESTAATPVGLIGWDETTGNGQPVITGDQPVGTFLGQRCFSATGFWSWTGTLWLKDSN